jgi:hypothetical protein
MVSWRVLWPVALSMDAFQVPRYPLGTAPSPVGVAEADRLGVGSPVLGPGVVGAALVARPPEPAFVRPLLLPSFINAYTEPPAPSATTSATRTSSAVDLPFLRGG